MITEADEEPRSEQPAGNNDAVAFCFADMDANVFGLVRVGSVSAADGGSEGATLAVLFADGELAIVQAARAARATGAARDADTVFSHERVSARVVEPLARWTLALSHGEHRLELGFEALCDPAELDATARGGMNGYEQVCRVTGRASVSGVDREIDCLGQRGHEWGSMSYTEIALTRSVAAWFAEDLAAGVSALRPAGAEHHDAETLSAWLLDAQAGTPRPVHEPRLSTTYDAECLQRRAGLELWVGEEDEFPRRAAGQALCGTSLPLGGARLDVAFMAWTMEGHGGAGPYTLLRPATA
ncbi:MAG: hypothetical protein ACR2HD_09790 [Solirubrobacteraceae bacterium]|nr:MAG: hypothetical protein DLM63_01815 [Solirubrobacterales bacterium]